MKRRHKGYWKNPKNFYKKLQEIKNRFSNKKVTIKEIKNIDHGFISACKKYYGGVRKNFDSEKILMKIRPKSYWDKWNNLKKEIDLILKENKKWPGIQYIQKNYSSVGWAINKWGMNTVRKKMGLDLEKAFHYKFSKKEIRKMTREYLSGKSTTFISKKYKTDQNLIAKILKKENITLRFNKNHRSKYLLNQNIFKNITTESQFYWLGFLMADGCITKHTGKYNTKTFRIHLWLKSTDVNHIKKFKSFLGSSHPIVYKKNTGFSGIGIAGLTIGSNKIANHLIKYGIVPRKSLIAEARRGAQNNRHFWRGMIDGDGTMGFYGSTKNKYSKIGLYGSKKTILQFIKFIEKELNILSNSIQKCKGTYSISYNCGKARQIAKLLYENSSTALDRKLKIAEEIIKYGYKKHNPS